jgi:NitT/TauT family transport system substrate-binding protein
MIKPLNRLKLSVTILASVLLAGCGGSDSSKTSDGGKSGSAQPTTVRLGYFPNVTHAQAVLGVVRGDYQKALGSNVKLETATFNAGPSVIEAVFAGHLDIAYVGPSPIINGFVQSKGEEIRVIAGSGANGVLIIAAKTSGITSLEQLKGRKIASPQLGNTQDISAKDFVVTHLKTQLKEKGGDTDVIPIANPDIESLFAKGQLDAAWVPEPWGSRIIANGLANKIAEEKDLWPNKQFALTNVIARRAFLEQYPDLVERILTAHVALTADLQKDPSQYYDAINQELKKLTGKDLPKTVLEQSFAHTQFTTDPSAESFERFFTMGKELKLVKGDTLDLSKLVDTRILKKIQASTTATDQKSEPVTQTSGTAAGSNP